MLNWPLVRKEALYIWLTAVMLIRKGCASTFHRLCQLGFSVFPWVPANKAVSIRLSCLFLATSVQERRDPSYKMLFQVWFAKPLSVVLLLQR